MEYFGIPTEIGFFSCLSSGGLVSYNIYEQRTSFSPNVSLDKDDYMGKKKYVLAHSGTAGTMFSHVSSVLAQLWQIREIMQ